MLRRLARLFTLKALAKDERGVSAIEFAMVAPILIMAYLGLAELTLGMMASRRTSHLAATIGDLAAQSENLTSANINDLWAIGNSMLEPFSTTPLQMRLTCVTMVSNVATVQWSHGKGGLADRTGSVPEITTAQISNGESLIMTEVKYTYTSPFGNFLPTVFPGQRNFSEVFYHHPRNGAMVTNTG